MIWIIINIALFVLGICLFGFALYENKDSEEFRAFFIFMIGLTLLACLVISEPLRWWLG